MTYDQAERHFGTQAKLARAFTPELPQSSVATWKRRGEIPRGVQFELAYLYPALKPDKRYLPR